MKVFVTGGTGVLGTPVVRKLLAAGYTVRALSRSEANRAKLIAAGAEPVEADLFNPATLRPALDGVSADNGGVSFRLGFLYFAAC